MMMKSNSSRSWREQVFQAALAAFDADEFDLGAGQVARGGNDREAVDRRRQNEFVQVGVGAGDRLVDRAAGRVLAFLSEAAGGVALGIAVDEQHFAAVEGEGGGQIDRRGGLSDSTFLVCDGDNLCHISALAVYYVD